MAAENCLDITIPFVEKTAERGIPIQIFGGVGTAAISLAETEYTSNMEIAPRKRIFIPRLRENGSPKDIDVQVLSTDQSLVDEVEQVAAETVGDQLEVNVFGLHNHTEIEDMIKRPFSWVAAKAATADRYVVGEYTGRDQDVYYKSVFPFGLPSQQSALETWHLVHKSDAPIPVPHPAMMILNNLTRSIAGMRRKYDEKTLIMTDNMMRRNPELIDWMVDGPARSQLELAGVLRAFGWLRIVRRVPSIKLSSETDLSITPPDSKSLLDHQAFLMKEVPTDLKKLVFYFSKVRSSLIVGPVERHWQDWWERHNYERFFRNTVRNK